MLRTVLIVLAIFARRNVCTLFPLSSHKYVPQYASPIFANCKLVISKLKICPQWKFLKYAIKNPEPSQLVDRLVDHVQKDYNYWISCLSKTRTNRDKIVVIKNMLLKPHNSFISAGVDYLLITYLMTIIRYI